MLHSARALLSLVALLCLTSQPARAQFQHLFSMGSSVLVDPVDVAVYDQFGIMKYVFVADAGLQQVVRFGAAGADLELMYGFPTSAPLTGIAVNDIPGHCNEGQVYVVAGFEGYAGGIINVYSIHGTSLKCVGWESSNLSPTSIPTGLAVDREGNVYVAEKRPSGGWVTKLDASHFGPPFFLCVTVQPSHVYTGPSIAKEASDVSVDLAGRVHLVRECGCMTIYEPGGTLLETTGGGVPIFARYAVGADALDIKGRTWASWVFGNVGRASRATWDWTNFGPPVHLEGVVPGILGNPGGLESARFSFWIPGSSSASTGTRCDERLFVCDRANAQVHVFGQETFSTPHPPDAISWWRFEARQSQCGGTLNVIRDEYGRNTGQIEGGTPVTTVGVVRGAFSTNHGQSTIRVPHDSSLDFGVDGSFSVEGWIMTRQTQGVASFLDKRQGHGQGLLLFTYNGHLGLQINWGVAHENYSPQMPENFVADGTWRHFAVVCDRTPEASTVSFFVDGMLVPGAITPNLSSFDTTNDLYIGAGNPGSSDTPLHGFLDELTIYSRALLSTEVADICTAEGAGKEVPYGRPGDPYCFGDGTGTICPCANHSLPGHGCSNATGVLGAILDAEGSSSASADDIVFAGQHLVPGKMALLFAGNNTLNSGNGIAFGNGLRCVAGSLVKLGVKIANSQGEAWWGPMLHTGDVNWTTGDTRYFQIWYRDPGGPCGFEFNLSNGYTVLFTD